VRRWATAAGVACVAAAVACVASAGTTTYSLTATKACLVKRGTQVQSPQTGAQAELPPAERQESLVGTLPVGTEPLFLYLAIGRSRAEALAIRTALKKTVVPNPSSGNSWAGEEANAAWIVVSIAGGSPGAAARKLVLSCLKLGSPPGPPRSYARSDVALCIQGHGRAFVVSTSEEKLLGLSIPPKLAPHLLLAFTSTSASTKDGLRLFVLFGKTHADALSLRSQLDRALGGGLHGSRAVWSGSKKNVAWSSQRLHGTTAAGIASTKRTLLSCLP
jgi:hypothetical protein